MIMTIQMAAIMIQGAQCRKALAVYLIFHTLNFGFGCNRVQNFEMLELMNVWKCLEFCHYFGTC